MAISITGYYDNEGTETGFFTQGSTTDDTSPRLQGTLDPLNSGDSVYIIRDGMLLGRVSDINTTTGTWSFQDNGLVDGHTYSYTMWVLGSTGLPIAISTPYSIKISAGPPPPPVLNVTLEVWDNQGPSTGQVSNNGTTDDNTPLLKGMLSAALVAGQSVHVFRNGEDLGVASVNGTNWEYTDSGLTSGNSYSYTAKVMQAGNAVATSTTTAITLAGPTPPGQTPTITEVYDDVAPITGAITNGMYTNDTRPAVSGKDAAPNTTVNIYDNNVKIGATTADGSGHWTYTPTDMSKLGNGEHSLTVTGIDATGNESAHSAAVAFTVDTLAPTAVARISAISENTNGHEFITSDKTLVVTAMVTGTMSLDERVQISMNNGATWHDTTPVSGSGNQYQYDATGTVLADGTYAFIAQVIDAAGNVAVGPRQDVMIDTVAPTLVATITSITEDTGASNTDFITADNTLLVTATVDGPLGVYQRVQISLDNGATWKDTMLASGGIFDHTSTWRYDATKTPLDDGTYTFQARVVDAARNVGPATDQTVVIDTTPPTKTTIDSYTDNVGPEQGNFPSGSTTDDRTPTLNGTLDKVMDAGERVRIYDANTHNALGYATVDASGKAWTYEITEPLADGSTCRYQAAVVDQAGNIGALSIPFTLTVDLSVLVNSQNTTDTTPIVTGATMFDIKPGEYMLVTVDNHTYDSRTGDVAIDLRNNTWAVQIPDANALATHKGGIYYDVAAVLMGADGKPITTDKTTNELFVSPLPDSPVFPAASDPSQTATAITLDANGQWLIFTNQNLVHSVATDSTTLGAFDTTYMTSVGAATGAASNRQNGAAASYPTSYANNMQQCTFVDLDRSGNMSVLGADSAYDDGQQAFIYTTDPTSLSGVSSYITTLGVTTAGQYLAIPYGNGYYVSVQIGSNSGVSSSQSTNAANCFTWYGGIVAIDKGGTGLVGVTYGDQTPSDDSYHGSYNTAALLNVDGTIAGMAKDGTFAWSGGPASVASVPANTKPLTTGQATPSQELSTVDLNNDGMIDLVYHASTPGWYPGGTPSTNPINTVNASWSTPGTSNNNARLVVLNQTADTVAGSPTPGSWAVSQIINGVFQNGGSYTNPFGANGVSMTWADFNGDGYMDLFLGRGQGNITGGTSVGGTTTGDTSAAAYQSRIYFNDGNGQLISTNATGVGTATTAGTYSGFSVNGLQTGPSLAIDWNHDGKMDIIAAPGRAA